MVEPLDDWSHGQGPPRRDPWDNYAVEKLQSFMIGEQVAIEDRNGGFTAGAIFSALATCVNLYWINSDPANATLMAGLSAFCTTIVCFACIVLRINGSVELRRINRHLKNLDRHGVRLL